MNISDKVNEWVTTAYNTNVTQWDENLQNIHINYNPVEKRHAFTFASKASNGTYSSNFFYDADVVSGTENEIEFKTKFTNDSNGDYYPHFGVILTNIFALGKYKLEPDVLKKPSKIKFTSITDPQVWFVITLVE